MKVKGLKFNTKNTSKSKNAQISVSKYLSIAVLLAEECGSIIRDVHDSGYLGQKTKGIDRHGNIDPVTKADLEVQKTLEENMHYFFPNL